MVSFFAAAPRHVAVTNGSGRTGTTTELSCTFEGRPLPNIKWLAFGGDLTQVSVANFCFKRLSKELQSFLLYKMIVKSSLLAFWKKRAACYFPEGGFSKQDSSSTSLGSSLKLELERLLILEKQATQLQLLHTLFGLQKIMLLFNLDFWWLFQDPIKYEITASKVNDKQVTSFLKIMDLTHMDNGTYLCHGENEYDIDVAILHNLVLDKPQVNIHKVVPVATDKIYFNWTVTDWNSPVTDYFLSVRPFLPKDLFSVESRVIL